jgi:site-specific DNA-cytosine methylase
MKVLQGMQECGYHCQHRVLNCAEHGDHTSRRRWFLTCFLHNGAIEWPTPSTEFEGLTSVLDDPKTVSLARIVLPRPGRADRRRQARPVPRTARSGHCNVRNAVPIPFQCGLSYQPQRKGEEESG